MDDLIWYVDEKTTLQTILFAQELGNKELGIVFSKETTKNKEAFKTLAEATTMKLKKGFYVEKQKDAQKAKGKYDFLIGLCERELVEYPGVKYLIGAESLERKDKTHRRGSGMNEVIAKLLAEKKKTYVFDLSLIIESQGTKIGRMTQNKRILGKKKCSMACYSMAKEALDLRVLKERKHFLEWI